MEDHKVKLTVLESGCPRYQPGDEIYFEGAFINKEKSAALCAVALNAVYPFVYAARRGGSGLGLSIVAAAARDHGWRWEAANSDGGVTFIIRFKA